MKYTLVEFKCVPNSEVLTDVLSAQLGEIGFHSFVANETGLEAYIPTADLSFEQIDMILADLPLEAVITYASREMEDKNWNEEWEKNYFQPVVIDDVLCIHSSFHKIEGDFKYRILIDPKMSFGTGHHQTTELMMRELLKMDLKNKALLDMGCGTAVLAILAAMRGATPITAIDIEEWAYKNAQENSRLNGINDINLLQGGAELLGFETYDVILANINRNILLQDMASYVNVLKKGGLLVMSGFYKDDIAIIRETCEALGMTYLHFSEIDQWVATSFCYQ